MLNVHMYVIHHDNIMYKELCMDIDSIAAEGFSVFVVTTALYPYSEINIKYG